MTTETAISPNELRAAAARLPRVSLGHLPTPLEELTRLSDKLGGPRIFIKRDDCTGLAFGGNKTRHNEFILGVARERACDLVVWGAGVQSNNCRQTAAACAKLGIDCHLVLSRADHSTEVQGNLLLDYIFGATVEFTDAPLGGELWAKLDLAAERFRQQGRRVFAATDPLVKPSGAVSYALALVEIAEQLEEQHVEPDAIYVCSCGVTGSGLFLGKKLLDFASPIRAIMPLVWVGDNHAQMADIANRSAELLGQPPCVSRDDITISPDYIGAGYGQATPQGMEATRLLAQTEGILVDPVYTAKALAAVIDDIRQGKLRRGQNVVFIHTGGTPALFAYQEDFAREFAPKS